MAIALIGGIFTLVRSLSWGFNDQIENITRKREYLKDLTKFMALETVDDAIALPKTNMSFETIAFNNVSFTTPAP